jgi:5-methylcytosine-specific restriction endonuclease McrA
VTRLPHETNIHWNHRRTMARSGNIYRHQKELAAKAGVELDYDILWLRSMIHVALGRPCLYCGHKITPKTFSLDHKIPVARGGSMSKYNLCVCCDADNSRKGALTRDEYFLLLGALSEMPLEAQTDIKRRLRAGSKSLMAMFRGGS